MSSHDWYRNTEWTEEGKQDFLQRIGRSRNIYNKAQYLRIQAAYISVSNVQDSLELLMMIINDYPDESQLSLTYSQLADCFVSQGKIEAAIDAYRHSLQAMRKFSGEHNQSYFNFAELILKEELSDLYQEALDFLIEFNSFLIFPKDRYAHHALRSLLLSELEENVKAKEQAQLAVDASKEKTSGFKYHPKVGIVTNVDSRIRAIANA